VLQLELTEVVSKETFEAGTIKSSGASRCIVGLSRIIYPGIEDKDGDLRSKYVDPKIDLIEFLVLNTKERTGEPGRLAEKFMGSLGGSTYPFCHLDLLKLKN
jgi:hypothetical protein